MVTAAPTLTPTEAVRRELQGGGVDVRGLAFQAALLFAVLVSLGVLVWLLWTVIAGGLSVFADRGTDFITSDLSGDPAKTGVAQGIYGSVVIVIAVAVLAFPTGVCAAIYLEEYAGKSRVTRFLDLNIRNLAGVPSVVFGLLGLAIFVEFLGNDEALGFNLTGGRTPIAAGLTLAVLVLPIVIITSAEALRAVPDSIREAGFGVGATRWEVTRSHVLPYAAPGIFTGAVLSLSRALGEAAPLIVIGAVSGLLAQPDSLGPIDRLQEPFTALPMQVFNFTRLPGAQNVANTQATIMVLLVVLLVANTAAVLLRNRYEKKR